MIISKNYVKSSVMASLLMLASSCYKQEVYDLKDDRLNKLTEVMSDRPQKDMDEITNSFHPSVLMNTLEIQRAIDSVAYRDMFEGTQLARNSKFLENYSSTLAKTRIPETYSKFTGEVFPDNDKIDKPLRDILTVGEMDKINKNPLSIIAPRVGLQYLIDSVFHHKLFEKYNLLDEAGMEKFNNICDKIRP